MKKRIVYLIMFIVLLASSTAQEGDLTQLKAVIHGDFVAMSSNTVTYLDEHADTMTQDVANTMAGVVIVDMKVRDKIMIVFSILFIFVMLINLVRLNINEKSINNYIKFFDFDTNSIR